MLTDNEGIEGMLGAEQVQNVAPIPVNPMDTATVDPAQNSVPQTKIV